MAESPYDLISLEHQQGMFVNSISIMTAISHQIEDIVLKHQLAVDLFAGFQRFSTFARQQKRYEQLAQICRRIFIWGIPDVEPPVLPRVNYIHVSETMEIAREWFLIVESPDFFTALLAQERTYDMNITQKERLFEGIWTYDASLVSQSAALSLDMLNQPYYAIAQRNYESQGRYMAQIFGNLMERNRSEQGDTTSRVMVAHRNALLSSGLASSETPMILLDTSKCVIAASDIACALLNTTLAEMIGQSISKVGDGLFAHRDPTRVAAPLMALLTLSETMLLSATSRSITDTDGQPIGWMVTLHHTTHRPPPERQRSLPLRPLLEPTCTTLEQHLLALPSLVSRPALHQRALDRTRQVLKQLQAQIRRFALLNDIESQSDMLIETMTPQALIEPILVSARIAARKQGITLTSDLQEAPSSMRCHPDYVRIALHELIDNLLRHAADCKKAALVVTREPGYICLAVEDDGCGIDAEQQQRLFQARGKTTSESADDSGTEQAGLGLELVRAVMRMHGGYLRLKSQRGQGSSFMLLLPNS
ncbi:MAG: hypothetical protein HC837_09675 [Chloroflexaceae bacterium]|nr:hypothetical protein [Chloroflexaceae bacterium]